MSTSRAIKSSYFWFFFVPIVAKTLNELEKFKIPFFEKTKSIEMLLPFTWEYFYYSAVFMAFANLIYIVFSPEFIKTYGACTEYIDKGHGKHQIIRVFLGFVHQAKKNGKNKLCAE